MSTSAFASALPAAPAPCKAPCFVSPSSRKAASPAGANRPSSSARSSGEAGRLNLTSSFVSGEPASRTWLGSAARLGGRPVRLVYVPDVRPTRVDASASASASGPTAPALEILSALPPAGLAQRRPLLFVHGSFHSAFCWAENFLPYFAALGHPSFALSLRGHGGSPATGLEDRAPVVEDYIVDIHDAFEEIERRAPGAGEPVLIGHSIGGLVLAKYVELYQPERVVFMCSMPPSGIKGIALRTLFRNPFEVWEFVQAFGMKKALSSVEFCRRAFFSDGVPDAEVERHMRRLKSPPRTLSLGKMTLADASKIPGRTRALVLGARNDFVVDVPAVHETAAAFGVQATIFDDAAHDLMLEPRWRDAAGTIADWLRS